MSKHPRPRGVCPKCDREITGRIVKGILILRPHNLAGQGTKASAWGPAIPCRGSGEPADRRTDLSVSVPGQTDT
jgi:hypothetical protein